RREVVGGRVVQALDVAPRVARRASSDERDTIVRTAEALAKSSIRAMRTSAAAGRIHCERDARNFFVTHFTSWLTPTRFEELRALTLRMSAVLERGRAERTGDPYEVFSIASPVTRRPGPAPSARPKARTRKKTR
ncbi:MAG: hypothetical protein ACKOJI_00510, partial [Phycisphaerales bacterium]